MLSWWQLLPAVLPCLLLGDTETFTQQHYSLYCNSWHQQVKYQKVSLAVRENIDYINMQFEKITEHCLVACCANTTAPWLSSTKNWSITGSTASKAMPANVHYNILRAGRAEGTRLLRIIAHSASNMLETSPVASKLLLMRETGRRHC